MILFGDGNFFVAGPTGHVAGHQVARLVDVGEQFPGESGPEVHGVEHDPKQLQLGVRSRAHGGHVTEGVGQPAVHEPVEGLSLNCDEVGQFENLVEVAERITLPKRWC